MSPLRAFQKLPSANRKTFLMWSAAVVMCGALAVGWTTAHSRDRIVEAVASTTGNPAVLGDIAGVFDELLAGTQVSNTLEFANRLTAIRPEALKSADWPDADYALFKVLPSNESDPQAVGIAVWAHGPVRGEAPVLSCAEVGVDRSKAGVRLKEIACPDKAPSEPLANNSLQQWANRLDIPVGNRTPLVIGQPATRGMAITGFFPASPEQAVIHCSSEDLQASFDSGNAAGNTDDYVIRVQNVSAEPCELSEATGIDVGLGTDSLRPVWHQHKSAVTLQSRESATAEITYRPESDAATQQISLQLQGGEVHARWPAGPSSGTLKVSNQTQISATAWKIVGYGIGRNSWENGYASVDIAAPCEEPDLAVTTPQARKGSGGAYVPGPLPYRLINISASTCRIDAGNFDPGQEIPSLRVGATVVLQPGTAVDLDGDAGAPNLFGTLLVDGRQLQVVPLS